MLFNWACSGGGRHTQRERRQLRERGSEREREGGRMRGILWEIEGHIDVAGLCHLSLMNGYLHPTSPIPLSLSLCVCLSAPPLHSTTLTLIVLGRCIYCPTKRRFCFKPSNINIAANLSTEKAQNRETRVSLSYQEACSKMFA